MRPREVSATRPTRMRRIAPVVTISGDRQDIPSPPSRAIVGQGRLPPAVLRTDRAAPLRSWPLVRPADPVATESDPPPRSGPPCWNGHALKDETRVLVLTSPVSVNAFSHNFDDSGL